MLDHVTTKRGYGDADYDVRYNYCDYDEKSFDTNEEWSKSFQNHCEYWKHRKPIEINDDWTPEPDIEKAIEKIRSGNKS